MSKVSIAVLFKKANSERSLELEIGEMAWQNNSLVA